MSQPLRFALSCALLLLLLPASAFGDEPQKNVLLFQSDDTSLPANVLVDRAIRSALKEGWKSPIQIYDEGLDSFRIPSEDYEAELVNLLRRKYQRVHFDLIFALSTPALRFLVKHQSGLFANSPIVFLVPDQSRLAGLTLGANVTGVSAKVELLPTLKLALALHPRTERVVVVAGNSPIDKGLLAMAQKEFQTYEGTVAFTYLTDLTPEEVRQRLAVLPDNAIVMYLSLSVDSTGKAYMSPEVVSQLAPTSRAPIYGSVETYLGQGIVGGQLLSFETLGIAAGQMGLRILAGESAQNIAPQTVPSVTMFDWRQLRRWGIDENKLPAGSIVRFEQPTFWELYKWRVVGAVSLIILQAMLIVGLLVNRVKRRRAEEARLASEAQLSGIIGSAMDAIITVDSDQRIVLFNSSAERIFGCSMTEAIGQSIERFIPERFRASHGGHVRGFGEKNVTRRSMGQLGDLYGLKSSGEEFPLEASISQIGVNGQKFFTVILRDITDRKRAIDDLRESEARFRHLADTAPVMIWMSGPDKLCTYFNQQWLDFTGRTMDQELGDGWAEGVHRGDYNCCLGTYVTTFDRREPFRMEYRLRREDGAFRWVFDIGAPRFSQTGEFLGYIGSAVDITDRKNAEEAKSQLATIVETSDDAILSKTLDGNITTWNAGAERIYGYSASEMVGRHVSVLVPAELREELTRILERLRRGVSVDHLETVRVTRDGRRINVSLTISPIKDPHGTIIGASTIARDISRRKQAEMEARRQRSELARLSRITMLGELSGSLAHELNQPLGAILRNTEAAELFLQNESPDLDEFRAILADIRKDDQRAGALIDRMRSMVKRREVEFSLLDLNLLVSEVIGMVRPEVDTRKEQLTFKAGSSLPPVLGDRIQLQQVLLNLLLNAMDAVNESALDRRVVTVRVQPAVAGVEVSVSDTGHGIDTDKLAHIFDAFFTTKDDGMGMGLAISRSIIEAHGGNIRAENNPDGGATFYFTLPVAKEENAS